MSVRRAAIAGSGSAGAAARRRGRRAGGRRPGARRAASSAGESGSSSAGSAACSRIQSMARSAAPPQCSSALRAACAEKPMAVSCATAASSASGAASCCCCCWCCWCSSSSPSPSRSSSRSSPLLLPSSSRANSDSMKPRIRFCTSCAAGAGIAGARTAAAAVGAWPPVALAMSSAVAASARTGSAPAACSGTHCSAVRSATNAGRLVGSLTSTSTRASEGPSRSCASVVLSSSSSRPRTTRSSLRGSAPASSAARRLATATATPPSASTTTRCPSLHRNGTATFSIPLLLLALLCAVKRPCCGTHRFRDLRFPLTKPGCNGGRFGVGVAALPWLLTDSTWQRFEKLTDPLLSQTTEASAMDPWHRKSSE